MVPQQVSFVERSSLSQRVPYRRFHCNLAIEYTCKNFPVTFFFFFLRREVGGGDEVIGGVARLVGQHLLIEKTFVTECIETHLEGGGGGGGEEETWQLHTYSGTSKHTGAIKALFFTGVHTF